MSRVVAAAFLLAASACSDGGDSGVVVPEVPTFEGAVDLEIGDVSGDDPFLFSRIRQVAADERGRVIVADGQSLEIRVFEPDGGFAFRFGGLGEGPGEFGDLCCVEFSPDGELWVRESARYSAFGLGAAGAEHQRVLATPHNVGLMAPFTFDAAGNLVSVGPVYRDDAPSLFARIRVRPDGTADTVVMAEAERQYVSSATVPFNRAGIGGVMYLHQPFGPRWVHAHANGGMWAEAVTSEYSINLHRPDGVSVIEGPALRGPPLSADDRAWAQGRIDRDLDRTGIARHPFGIPDRKPPLADVFFDRGGRLWVVKTVREGAAVREADVWDGTTLVARYRWPRRIRESPRPWATESALHGVTEDSLGVQRAARVRFERR